MGWSLFHTFFTILSGLLMVTVATTKYLQPFEVLGKLRFQIKVNNIFEV
jgi:hypothetical protein